MLPLTKIFKYIKLHCINTGHIYLLMMPSKFLSFQLKMIFLKMIYNALSGNFTVNQILKKIKKYKKKVRIKFVASAIMNQLSYHVSKEKLNKEGLILKSNLNKDIKATIKLLDNI